MPSKRFKKLPEKTNVLAADVIEKLLTNIKKNIVRGDVAELDTITNNLEIFMFKEKDRVYGKRKQ